MLTGDTDILQFPSQLPAVYIAAIHFSWLQHTVCRTLLPARPLPMYFPQNSQLPLSALTEDAPPVVPALQGLMISSA